MSFVYNEMNTLRAVIVMSRRHRLLHITTHELLLGDLLYPETSLARTGKGRGMMEA